MNNIKDQIYENQQREPLTEVITIEGEEPWPEEWSKSMDQKSNEQDTSCTKSDEEINIEEQIYLDEQLAKELQRKFYEEDLESDTDGPYGVQYPVHFENPKRQLYYWDIIDNNNSSYQPIDDENEFIDKSKSQHNQYDEEYDEQPQRSIVIPYRRRTFFGSDFIRRVHLFDNVHDEQSEDEEEGLEWNRIMSLMNISGRILNRFFD